jgi:predicted esterase
VTQEHHLEIPRTARYFTSGNASDPAEIWIVLHGYGQLAERFLSRFAPADDGRRLFVAPEGLSRFYVAGKGGPDSKVGASWMTREDRLTEIADYLRYLDAMYDELFARRRREAVRLHVLGFSQGTATATRWALRGKARPDRLVLWAGLLPPDDEWRTGVERLNALDLTFVVGERDEWVAGNLAIAEAALQETGVRYRVIRFAGGHEIDAEALRALVGVAPTVSRET